VARCYSETSGSGNAEVEGIILLKSEDILSKEEGGILRRTIFTEERKFFSNIIEVLRLQ
jgi:hypothetical protein